MAYSMRQKKARKQVSYLIKDEMKAPKEYRELQKNVKCPKCKKAIESIIRDEEKHLKIDKKIQEKLKHTNP